jgi:hypothetical protein
MSGDWAMSSPDEVKKRGRVKLVSPTFVPYSIRFLSGRVNEKKSPRGVKSLTPVIENLKQSWS